MGAFFLPSDLGKCESPDHVIRLIHTSATGNDRVGGSVGGEIWEVIRHTCQGVSGDDGQVRRSEISITCQGIFFLLKLCGVRTLLVFPEQV